MEVEPVSPKAKEMWKAELGARLQKELQQADLDVMASGLRSKIAEIADYVFDISWEGGWNPRMQFLGKQLYFTRHGIVEHEKDGSGYMIGTYDVLEEPESEHSTRYKLRLFLSEIPDRE